MSLAQRHRTYPRGLRVYGLDFSSAPCLRKPITCAVGRLVRGLQALTFLLVSLVR